MTTSNKASYLQISSSAAAVVKATPGTLVRLIIGGSSSNATAGQIVVIDGTSAGVGTTAIVFPAGVYSGSYECGMQFDTKITVKTGADADEVTAVYL